MESLQPAHHDDLPPPSGGAHDGWHIESLLAASAFAHRTGNIELRETHLSWIILTGLYAYKIKKPVHLDFIDASTLERRRQLCEEELRLNQRLSPGLYIDVLPVTRDERDRVHLGGEGIIVDYAVRMRQFDPLQALHHLLERNAVSMFELQRLADRLAEFHGAAAVAAANDVYGSLAHLSGMTMNTVNTLRKYWPAGEDTMQWQQLEHWTHQQLNRLEAEFNLRRLQGAIREGHGDLHADNVVRWQGELMPFDCLEFDPALRWIDVIHDVAFLVMDLATQRPDLAFGFLNRYLEDTGDYCGIRLLAFYAVHCALVRGMVNAVNISSSLDTPRQIDCFRLRMQSAGVWMKQRSPFLILMHGPSGSGKSWTSEPLIPALQAVRIRSDLERKRLANVPLQAHRDDHINQGIYHPSFTSQTYAHLLKCAEQCLQGGVNTIVDAAFLHETQRRAFAMLAAHMNIRYFILSCSAEPRVLRQRVVARRQTATDPSDAGIDVLEKQLQALQPFTVNEEPHVIRVRSDDDRDASSLAAIIRRRLMRDGALTEA